jgi:hypothetical protein
MVSQFVCTHTHTHTHTHAHSRDTQHRLQFLQPNRFLDQIIMEKFTPVPLSVSGKPVLAEGEVEVKSEPSTQVFLQKDCAIVKELYPVGTTVLTNFRLIIILKSESTSGSGLVGWGLHLSSVRVMEDCAAGLFKRSTRMRILFNNDAPGQPVEIGIKFILGIPIKEEFILHANRTLARKSWELTVAQKKEAQPQQFSTANAGVSGLLRRQEKEMKSIDSLSKEALTDLDALMKSARDVVTVVQRYAAHAAEKYAERDEDGERSETSTEIGEVNQMDAILQNIGIISPVTKFSAGRMYHVELARQLADLLLADNRMTKLGGFATLTDIYCLLNRARGTELVSPNDFRKAAELVDTLNVGLKFKRYPSGVLVLHLSSLNENVASQQLVRMCSEAEFLQTGLSATNVANRLSVSIVVAKELLLGAESSGALCRDESIDGLYFYKNIFV